MLFDLFYCFNWAGGFRKCLRMESFECRWRLYVIFLTLFLSWALLPVLRGRGIIIKVVILYVLCRLLDCDSCSFRKKVSPTLWLSKGLLYALLVLMWAVCSCKFFVVSHGINLFPYQFFISFIQSSTFWIKFIKLARIQKLTLRSLLLWRRKRSDKSRFEIENVVAWNLQVFPRQRIPSFLLISNLCQLWAILISLRDQKNFSQRFIHWTWFLWYCWFMNLQWP